MEEMEDFAFIDVPKNYCNYTKKQKKAVCNKIIDILLFEIDKALDPTINRITFLDEVLESSLKSNEDIEMYEICACLLDIRTILNED